MYTNITPKRRCHRCGNFIPQHEVFCHYCGNQLPFVNTDGVYFVPDEREMREQQRARQMRTSAYYGRPRRRSAPGCGGCLLFYLKFIGIITLVLFLLLLLESILTT